MHRLLIPLTALGFSLALVTAQAAPAVPPVKGTHAAQGVTCKDCHNKDVPDSAAPMSACLDCHGSYAALAKKTARLGHNPHQSHLGEVECDLCHKPHGADVIYCNECHNFTDMKPR